MLLKQTAHLMFAQWALCDEYQNGQKSIAASRQWHFTWQQGLSHLFGHEVCQAG
jgi:hypothetical protein